MTTKDAYAFNPLSGEYEGITIADESPLEPGVYLYPANSTDKQPPSVSANQIPVFKNGSWAIEDDYRGTTYYDADGTEHKIKEIGTTPPKNSTPTPPPLTKQQATTNQLITLSQAYGKAIEANISFTSTDGSSKVYQADTESFRRLQNKLTTYQGKQATPSGFYWVSEDNTQVPFTYADLQNLAETIGDRGNKAFQHLQTLKNTIRTYLADSTKTVKDIEGVTW